MWEYNNFSHSGIPGMKWGIRRYQNKDGTRTSAGKKRETGNSMNDDELMSKVRRLNLEEQYKKMSKQAAKPSKMEKTKKVVDATSSLVNEAKKISKEASSTKEKMNLSKMTDQQLRDRINRTNLEKQYNDMFAPPATVSKGKKYASDILEVAGTTLAIGSSALGIALAIKELRG